MRFGGNFEKIKKWLESDELEIVYKLLAVITAMCLVFSYAITKNKDSKEKVTEITAHIKGEVVNPGVYTLENDSRINDIVNAAGGFTDDADTFDINLSEKLLDEEVVFIPKKSVSSTGAVVNINTADAAELDTLPGIGKTYAERIIKFRNECGNFRNIEQLLNVDGIGEKQFEKIKNLITV